MRLSELLAQHLEQVQSESFSVSSIKIAPQNPMKIIAHCALHLYQC